MNRDIVHPWLGVDRGISSTVTDATEAVEAVEGAVGTNLKASGKSRTKFAASAAKRLAISQGIARPRNPSSASLTSRRLRLPRMGTSTRVNKAEPRLMLVLISCRAKVWPELRARWVGP